MSIGGAVSPWEMAWVTETMAWIIPHRTIGRRPPLPAAGSLQEAGIDAGTRLAARAQRSAAWICFAAERRARRGRPLTAVFLNSDLPV
jgi:hypothetical protein